MKVLAFVTSSREQVYKLFRLAKRTNEAYAPLEEYGSQRNTAGEVLRASKKKCNQTNEFAISLPGSFAIKSSTNAFLIKAGRKRYFFLLFAFLEV